MTDEDADAYVVFPKPQAGDIKRMSKKMADGWYPNHARATAEQWAKQKHPALGNDERTTKEKRTT